MDVTRQVGEDPEEYFDQFLVNEWAGYFVGKMGQSYVNQTGGREL